MLGTLKWFSEKSGYGFITGEDGFDYFVHYTAFGVKHTSALRLKPGTGVRFLAGPGRKAMEASIDKK